MQDGHCSKWHSLRGNHILDKHYRDREKRTGKTETSECKRVCVYVCGVCDHGDGTVDPLCSGTKTTICWSFVFQTCDNNEPAVRVCGHVCPCLRVRVQYERGGKQEREQKKWKRRTPVSCQHDSRRESPLGNEYIRRGVARPSPPEGSEMTG